MKTLVVKGPVERALRTMEMGKELVDAYEIRLDAFEDRTFENIKKVVAGSTHPLIFTLRREACGGLFSGPDDDWEKIPADVQAALIARRLEHARDQGCELVTIGSRPGIATERNAARLGFYVAYTKVIMAMPGEGLTSSP